MTKLLERAFVEVSKLPQQEQDTLATWILEELASERQWDELFAKSPHVLEQLADEALAEFRAGRTQVLDPDNFQTKSVSPEFAFQASSSSETNLLGANQSGLSCCWSP